MMMVVKYQSPSHEFNIMKGGSFVKDCYEWTNCEKYQPNGTHWAGILSIPL